MNVVALVVRSPVRRDVVLMATRRSVLDTMRRYSMLLLYGVVTTLLHLLRQVVDSAAAQVWQHKIHDGQLSGLDIRLPEDPHLVNYRP